MRSKVGAFWKLALLAWGFLPAGCSLAPTAPKPPQPPARLPPLGASAAPGAIIPASAVETSGEGQAPPRPAGHGPRDSGWAGQIELTPDAVVKVALERNPSLAEMAAAAEAAAARYPQAISFDDPILTAWMAPATIDAKPPAFLYSQRVELSQKVPWPGKRQLRGEQALAQSAAAGQDFEDARLRLVESARDAFWEYYLAERALEVNAEGLRLLEDFKKNAAARVKVGQAPQQDLVQADVEIGRQNEQRFALIRARTVAVARLNTLMNLPTDAPLPPPAGPSTSPGGLPDARALRSVALSRRPDLKALAARIAAERAALGLAEREYYPDVEFMAAYDTFWTATQQQPQIGVRFNLPVQTARRDAAVAEAMARVARRQAEFTRQVNEVAFEVEQASAQVRESEQAVRLYEEKILPDAQRNVKEATAAYVAPVGGRGVPFVTLIEAQRSVVGLRDRYFQALADLQRRRANLERVIGGPLAVPGKTEAKEGPSPDQAKAPGV